MRMIRTHAFAVVPKNFECPESLMDLEDPVLPLAFSTIHKLFQYSQRTNGIDGFRWIYFWLF